VDDLGRILLADDEEAFRESTAELLRREGYACDSAPDGIQALDMLKTNSYDSLIADIRMPGNPELQFIRTISELSEGLPVILVPGYHSVKSAIQSIQLPVFAYLVKPFEFSDLLAEVRKSVREHKLFQKFAGARRRMQDWRTRLKEMEDMIQGLQQRRTSTSIETFLAISCHNIMEAVLDLKTLTKILSGEDEGKKEVCHLLICPRLSVLKNSMKETIEVLEKTKDSFKSKELGKLRKKLEDMMKERD